MTNRDVFDYVGAMQRLLLFVPILADACDDIEQCLATIERSHSIGAILDPTAYRNGMRNLDDAAEVLEALAPAAHKLRAFRDKIAARKITDMLGAEG